MSTVRITIDTDNAAFEDWGAEHEIARILRKLADDFDAHGLHTPNLRDANGNRVGHVTID